MRISRFSTTLLTIVGLTLSLTAVVGCKGPITPPKTGETAIAPKTTIPPNISMAPMAENTLHSLPPLPTLSVATKLPPLGADPAKISVSGLSSGGFMAVQYDVAFSASTMGAGVVAGGPYNCFLDNGGRLGNLSDTSRCMSGAPSGDASFAAANKFANQNLIDDPSNLKSHKIYLFSGTQDNTVKQTVMNALNEFYVKEGVPSANIQYLNNVPAGHAFISTHVSNNCGTTMFPYINKCDVGGSLYDQPNAILTRIYGPLQPKSNQLSSSPMTFDQTEFKGTGLADTGYVYIPSACRNGGATKCSVHVVFHGCLQDAAIVQDKVYGQVGYNEWADSNNIIVLYPQTALTAPVMCWDWFGYTGSNFQTKSSPQISAVKKMVDRLTSQ